MIPGIHHVTAICGDAQRNVDFYARVLGLRLVKRTVNFDAPDMYHLYYGDERGTPGTIVTFFPWPGASRGRRGTGQAIATAFSIQAGAIGFWVDRLRSFDVRVEEPRPRFDETVVAFEDHDGLMLELVASPRDDPREPGLRGEVPAAHAIRGVFGVALAVDGYERSADLLTGVMGFRPAGEQAHHFRFETGTGAPRATVDLQCLPDAPPGRVAVGTVHHVAFRARDDVEQQRWREQLVARGFNVTPVLDRTYFRSIYFREPGGVLFEIATDAPGFTADEPADELGSSLKLPAWLEPNRRQIELLLPELSAPPPPA